MYASVFIARVSVVSVCAFVFLLGIIAELSVNSTLPGKVVSEVAVVSVGNPFVYIAEHVVEAPLVGFLFGNGLGIRALGAW